MKKKKAKRKKKAKKAEPPHEIADSEPLAQRAATATEVAQEAPTEPPSASSAPQEKIMEEPLDTISLLPSKVSTESYAEEVSPPAQQTPAPPPPRVATRSGGNTLSALMADAEALKSTSTSTKSPKVPPKKTKEKKASKKKELKKEKLPTTTELTQADKIEVLANGFLSLTNALATITKKPEIKATPKEAKFVGASVSRLLKAKKVPIKPETEVVLALGGWALRALPSLFRKNEKGQQQPIEADTKLETLRKKPEFEKEKKILGSGEVLDEAEIEGYFS